MLPHRHSASPMLLADTNPPFYSDIIFWLYADSISNLTSPDTVITNWVPIAGIVTNFVSSSSGTNLLYKSNRINGHSSVYFYSEGLGQNANSYIFDGQGVSGWWSSNDYYHCFWVLKPSGAHDWANDVAIDIFCESAVIPASGSLGDHYYDQNSGHMNFSFFSSVTYDCGISSIDWTNRWHQMDVHSYANDWALYLTNILQFSTNVNTVKGSDGVNGSTMAIGLGRQPSATISRYYDGEIAEVIMYHKQFTPTERTTVYNWLKAKYWP